MTAADASQSADICCPAAVLSPAERFRALGHSGATVWLTGLSGAGKSTLAGEIERRLVAAGRPAFRLDGDELRTGLCCDLGFDAHSRDENVRRAAEAAKLIAASGVVAIASLISPYRAGREHARQIHEAQGLPFLEVWMATPLAECERRDTKGLYARARRGEIKCMTGVDDPYEEPESPDLAVGPELELDAAADMVLESLHPPAARLAGLSTGPAAPSST